MPLVFILAHILFELVKFAADLLQAGQNICGDDLAGSLERTIEVIQLSPQLLSQQCHPADSLRSRVPFHCFSQSGFIIFVNGRMLAASLGARFLEGIFYS